MNKQITCFLPAAQSDELLQTISDLQQSGLIDKFVVISKYVIDEINDVEWIISENIFSTQTIKEIASKANTDYTLLYLKSQILRTGQNALHRMKQVCFDCNAGMVYSDYYENKSETFSFHPVIEYQEGSLRNDFDFGSVLFLNTNALKQAVSQIKSNYLHAGLYDLRLKISANYRIVHINEALYTEIENDTRKSGEKLFDYVNPSNRNVQIEMEQACTEHLKSIGAWLEPKFQKVDLNKNDFEFEASVIIPVKNRVKTIGDAIISVLKQKTAFKFNLLIVDNYSTDGTTELINEFAKNDNRILHIIPERTDLGIGGCWNEAISHHLCGKFAIQLDSDDLYIDENVITKIVQAFYQQNCAMVIGSYQMVNFNLQPIPPGLIDHREWTPENGRNNALRINGLGAPRAFYTPVIRSIKMPNVSYGEDYALGLHISRFYQIGRIYEPLYLCRRWDENSDAALDIIKMNTHNFYKDKIRTLELWARIQYNKHFTSL